MNRTAMNRRQFVRTSLLAAGAGGLILNRTPLALAAATSPVLVHTMLFGGADLRFLFAPAPSHPHASFFWEARRALYITRHDNGLPANYLDYAEAFADQYDLANFGDHGFGIHKSAGWLKQMYESGKVAIVANAYGSNNRRHDHSQLIALTGDLDAGRTDYNRNGWGGRLVQHINAAAAPGAGVANVVSMSSQVPIFCWGDNALNRLENVVHTPNTRNFGFDTGDANENTYASIMARALTSYYGVRGAEVAASAPQGWPYRIFFEHEQNIRGYAELFNNLIDTIPQPAAIAALRSGALHDNAFGTQCANLYDALFATDILGMRVAHMDYGHWDTHSRQQTHSVHNLHDLFGTMGGTATLMNQLATDNPSAADDLVFVYASDFGRQLAANGDRGTDHGNGTYSLIVGNSVFGGVYGDMFHPDEIAPDASGLTLYDRPGSGITGRTSVEEVFSRLCEWADPGAGASVFPGADGTAVEPGVTLNFI